MSAIGALPTVAMEMGNEGIEMGGMGDHVARLALEIRNEAVTPGPTLVNEEPRHTRFEIRD